MPTELTMTTLDFILIYEHTVKDHQSFWKNIQMIGEQKVKERERIKEIIQENFC